MSVTPSDKAFATELFAPLGTITTRPMMGGACLYADAMLFGIIDSEGQIYLRAKGALADRLATEGCRQFSYSSAKSGKIGSMAYWTLPEDALDDTGLACDWARQSLNASEN